MAVIERLIVQSFTRNRPLVVTGAKGSGKTTLMKSYAGQFSNWIHLDLETMVDRAIFNYDVSVDEMLKAISFLKGKELRGSGTMILLDEISFCPGAVSWFTKILDQRKSGIVADKTGASGSSHENNFSNQLPYFAATASVMTPELAGCIKHGAHDIQVCHLSPFSFEEFLIMMADKSALEAFREVPVPYYAYEKLLAYFHQYTLTGGMPEIASMYADTRRFTSLKKIYGEAEEQFLQLLPEVTKGSQSRLLAREVLQSAYPFAATRVNFNQFGNLGKGSREIGRAFKAIENIYFLKLLKPVTSTTTPTIPNDLKSPRVQLVDTGLVNFFAGIQKPLYQSHDMNAIFEGQIARQVVGQEIMATNQIANGVSPVNFWIRNKAQSNAEVDFVIEFRDLLIPVSVKSGEPGRLRSLHQYIDDSPHSYAVRLYAGMLTVQQATTVRGKKFYLLNLPYFLAGKIRDHLKGFIRFTSE